MATRGSVRRGYGLKTWQAHIRAPSPLSQSAFKYRKTEEIVWRLSLETRKPVQQPDMENSTNTAIPAVSTNQANFPVTTETPAYHLTTGLGVSTVIHVGVDADDGSFNAILGGVIATVILVLLCLAVVLLRYMYRHKGSYSTNEAKGTEFAETADAALKKDPALQGSVDDSNKEYFI
ncbi:hypothetical protein SKAU_G00250200 [Synaphobranchus kaupii]|uniref:Neurexin/syndecan/glycophorin C domain-containing protein n=1 Tax=Synaphobranchus kaupii TaxID=118154 RepID=A0A9Q1F2P7_SYNKA|nr:hypothetical protein SKAU_G00250200 [Synaphobranchus kaupii]